ncbi:uncharacterized protein LOC127748774 [Frankliniella occidentalis]|uniref:Uncharacterized protein LOC127748774 n=1 Tax=Frankliniella occidentalis TaxID=133901 RepID=A0A9C6WVE5_FRAOC|nr:uncharacterized protein LOC127748774 [Frankliniella occidentalis]
MNSSHPFHKGHSLSKEQSVSSFRPSLSCSASTPSSDHTTTKVNDTSRGVLNNHDHATPTMVPPSNSSSAALHPQSTTQNLNSSSTGTAQQKFFQLILNKVNKILLTQKNHTQLLNRLVAHSGIEGPTTPRPSGWPEKLPLQDEVQFFAWERFLRSNSNYDYAVNYFSNAVCDKTFEACTRQILIELISKSLKHHLNWKGTEKKYGIKDTRTGQLVFGLYF